MRIYGDSRSGNCYKLKLLLNHLGQQVDWHEVDVLSGYTRDSEFLKRNPAGQIPLLQLEDGRTLAQSNAILYYLADGTEYIPSDRWAHAQMLQWQNFEQYTHEPTIAVARFIRAFLGLPESRRSEYETKLKSGAAALAVMEAYLSKQAFFGGDKMSLADISLYAYTHVAEDGGFSLAEFPVISRWLHAVAEQPGHLPMQEPGSYPAR